MRCATDDYFMVGADFDGYFEPSARSTRCGATRAAWWRAAILNTAGRGLVLVGPTRIARDMRGELMGALPALA